MIKKILLLLILFSPIYSKANEIIVTQGEIVISYKDIDGYAYFKIPVESRRGFFDSPKRIEQTLMTLLTMKHVVNYGLKNNIVDKEILNSKVSIKLLETYPSESIKRTMQEELIYQNIVEFIKLEEAFKLMKLYIVESITEEDVIDLAEENFILNKDYYLLKNNRNITIINIKYNEDTKEKNHDFSKAILNDLINTISYDKEFESYKNNEDVEVITDFTNYEYDYKFKEFSDLVFSSDKTGVINTVFDAKDKFTIVIVNDIVKRRHQTFLEVKGKIVNSLKKKKIETDFNNLILKLTHDKVNIYEDNVIRLRNRYK